MRFSWNFIRTIANGTAKLIARKYFDRFSRVRFRLMDICCLSYMAILALLLPFFHREVPFWPSNFAIHAIFVFGGLELIRLGETRSQNLFFKTLRTFYPVIFILYGWDELNEMARMFSGSFWMTDFLVSADEKLFGVHPTVWMQQFYAPWLDEIMCFLYAGYYLMIPLATLPLFIRGKQRETMAVLSIGTLTYFANFALFYILPSVCPRAIPWLDSLHAADYSGYLFASIIRFLQQGGSVVGGCFPSSHVSASFVWAFAAWRYNRKMGYLLLPLALGVALSSVYLRYHHAVDPITGLILAVVVYFIAIFVLRKRAEDPLATS